MRFRGGCSPVRVCDLDLTEQVALWALRHMVHCESGSLLVQGRLYEALAPARARIAFEALDRTVGILRSEAARALTFAACAVPRLTDDEVAILALVRAVDTLRPATVRAAAEAVVDAAAAHELIAAVASFRAAVERGGSGPPVGEPPGSKRLRLH